MWLEGWDVEQVFGPDAGRLLAAKHPYYPMVGVGVGIEWEMRGDQFYITSVDPTGPSHGHLREGDCIIEVEGEAFQTSGRLHQVFLSHTHNTT